MLMRFQEACAGNHHLACLFRRNLSPRTGLHDMKPGIPGGHNQVCHLHFIIGRCVLLVGQALMHISKPNAATVCFEGEAWIVSNSRIMEVAREQERDVVPEDTCTCKILSKPQNPKP